MTFAFILNIIYKKIFLPAKEKIIYFTRVNKKYIIKRKKENIRFCLNNSCTNSPANSI